MKFFTSEYVNQNQERYYRQSDADRYALQCYSSGLGFAELGEGLGQVGIPAGKD